MMINKRVNALWFCSWYPSDYQPSLGDFVQRQAIATSTYSNIIVIGFFPKENLKTLELRTTDQNENLKEIIVYYPERKKNIFYSMLNFWDKYRAYKKAIRAIPSSWSADIVHSHILLSSGFFAFLFSKSRKLPFVISEHASFYANSTGKFNRLLKAMLRNLISKSKSIITVSDRLREDMKRFGLNGNYITIPNVLDRSLFIPRDNNVEKKGQSFQWIHTSTLAKGIKNIEGILEAVSILSYKRKDFRIKFIGGNNSLISTYVSLAESLGIGDLVSFEAEKVQKEMVEELKNADAYISFSNSETFGLAILEALCVGIPCLVTNTGEVHQWINDKTGRIIEVGDVNSLVSNMAYMMDNMAEFDTSEITKFVESNYSYQVVGEKISDVYLEVLNIKA